MDLKRVFAVLCHPEDPRNVGAAIRAVANHGLGGLRYVTRGGFGEEELFHFSAGASENVPVEAFSELDAAIADCAQVLGTSRRTRDPLAPPCWPAAGLRARLARKGRVALLFGTERTGLERDEVDRCQAIVAVPTTPAHYSLNLGHAVAILAYELARPEEAVGPPPAPAAPLRAPVEVREAFYRRVEEISRATGYPPGRNPELFARKLRRVLDRANLNAAEFGMIAGVFSELERLHTP
ncbi:MAG: hypothetical protein KC549_14095 [Myxococcales bacterium]|nr:hypothetical protein [Myxococcales bacterium]MCB9544486.1 hypothetical protein [Myxococcales bacterium]